MRDYEELVKRLHNRIALTTAGSPLQDDLLVASDAIEELQKRVLKTPHGRLIDADALFEEVYKAWGIEHDASDCNSLMGFINDAPTILPASEEGE